jgi:hypothetical protein
VGNDNVAQDWVADYNREGREQVMRDIRDSGVVMMTAAAEGSGSGG